MSVEQNLKLLYQLDPLKKQAAEKRYKKNVAGKWYVDEGCVGCNLCRELAFNNFKKDDRNTQHYVSKQPADEKELKQCLKAKDLCPVDAIHNN
jgi:ferredoxin